MSLLTCSVAVSAVALIASCGPHALAVVDAAGSPAMRGDSLELTARSALVADSLVVRVVGRNAAHDTLSLAWGACSLDVLLYRSAARDRAAFDWAKRSASGAPEACPMYMATAKLAPGDTISPQEFRLAIPVARIGLDSLGVGQYFVAAHLLGVMVPAGAVELR